MDLWYAASWNSGGSSFIEADNDSTGTLDDSVTSGIQLMPPDSHFLLPSYTLSVAPMMDWTDRHCRYLFRLLSRHSLLYTEMVAATALIHGNVDRHLAYHPQEHPLALQLGGSNPTELAQAVDIANRFGFDEINLNMGCPSDRVANACFGAKLITLPDLAMDCIKAMQDVANGTEITVKCRIGVDDDNPCKVLPDLVARMEETGIKRVIVHARKAYLNGLSPKENRTVPPLDYELVHAMKSMFPDLTICINGGIDDLDQVKSHLNRGISGVMVGRAAYRDPVNLLLEADHRIFSSPNPDTLDAVIYKMIRYMAQEVERGTPIRRITRHMLGLFTGRQGAKIWRRNLSSQQFMDCNGVEGIRATLQQIKSFHACN